MLTPVSCGHSVICGLGGFRGFTCFKKYTWFMGFPGGTVVTNPPADAGDMGSRPGPGRSHMPRSN